VPLPSPLLPEVMVIQPALLTAVQSQPAPAVTVALPLPALAVTLWDVGFTAYVHGMPSCVTVSVLPAIVRVPVRGDVDALAAIAYVVVPLPVPLAPAVIVSHPALLTAVHAQPVPAVTVAVAVSALASTFSDVGLTL
jgi:hypothetical protein